MPGSTGQNQSPAHVFHGQAHGRATWATCRRTIPNLEIVRIDAERQLLLVKGSVPGSSGRDVVVRLAVKGQRAPVKAQAPKAGAGGTRRQPKPGSRSPQPSPPAKG